MIDAVLDSSAVMASLNREPGHEQVDELVGHACISSVNLAEIVTKLTSGGITQPIIEAMLAPLSLTVEAFDAPRAYATGLLTTFTSKAGLSLGDRACLSLAGELGLRAVTADKAWSKVDVEVEIQVIR